MEIKIIGTPKEIADLVNGLQSKPVVLNSTLNVDGKEIASHLYLKIRKSKEEK